MSEEQELIRVLHDGVLTLTINRPARRNALTRRLVEELTGTFLGAGGGDGVRVIVLTGAGDRAFSAGADLADQVSSEGMLGLHHGRHQFVELLLSMHRCRVPIIARVNGYAMGGGFGIALNCDLVVASTSAVFATPEIKVGMFPMMIMAVIARNLGRKRAMEMMLTGEKVRGADAVSWGIANSAHAPEDLDAAVQSLATRVAGFSPAILRLGRQAFYKTQDMSFEQALATLHNELTINTLAEDAGEGISAFFAGREPEWKGR